MFAESASRPDALRLAVATALCLFVFLIDLAAPHALAAAQLYPAALLPLYGTRHRPALAGIGLLAVTLVAFATLAAGTLTAAVLAGRALSVGMIALAIGCLDRLGRHEHELWRLALVDPLTGVFNRRSFFEISGKEEARTRRGGHQFAVLMVDIDHFKQINDRFGHPAGDQVIKTLAEVCARTLRPSDVIARYGGEEFVINLPDTDQRHALSVAERLRRAIADTRVASEAGAIAFTVSIGVATCSDETPLAEAIGHADRALYLAKHNGRDRVEATVAAPAPAPPPVIRTPSVVSACTARKTAGKGILVVDDEAEIRELVAEWLTDSGYAVRTADNARNALQLLENDAAIDLIFTDIVMPGGLDGFDLSRQADVIRPGIKVLYMSGFAATQVARARRGEVARVLHKPFRLNHVLESVAYALQH
jgi:diguanylate cyclase (GGDEF)-like protein